MKNHEDSWKNKQVFEAQLRLNEEELNAYPFHWECLLKGFSFFKYPPESFLDLGCGCGAISELCKRHFPGIKYRGLDYAKEAIEVASNRWDADWQVRDYRELTEEDLSFDTLHTGAMLDVLPNADEAFRFLVESGFKNIIVGRMKIVDEESSVETVEAYGLINTYSFYHNKYLIHNILTDNGYHYRVLGYHDNATIIASKEELVDD